VSIGVSVRLKEGKVRRIVVPTQAALQSHSNISLASLQEARTSPHCNISGVRNESTMGTLKTLVSLGTLTHMRSL